MQRVRPHPIEMATRRSAHWSYGRLRTRGTKGRASATSVALDESGRASLSRRPLGETASEPTTMSSAGGSAGRRGSAEDSGDGSAPPRHEAEPINSIAVGSSSGSPDSIPAYDDVQAGLAQRREVGGDGV